MLPLFSWTVYLLVFALSGVVARAVDTNITSLPISNTSSPMLSESTNGTASSESCTDIKTCRTLDQIIVSCLVTILACVWFAVHRNVPAPKQKPSKHPSAFVRAARRAWSVVLVQLDAAMVFVVALLAPEWILAWAIRQAITAWRLAGELEEARLVAEEKQKERNLEIPGLEEHVGEIAISADGHSSVDVSVATHTDSEAMRLIHRRSATDHAICQRCEGNGSQCHRVAAAKRVAKGDEGWKWSHGFLVTMGGLHFYNADGPLYPLSTANVVELVKRGHLVPPTTDEISDKSKGDALSKGVAIFQTLWFVVQCIARRAEQLPVTSLEVMTLAYTVMTMAMYAAWWAKPLNVSCAVRVPVEEVEEQRVIGYDSVWGPMFAYLGGGQDDFVDLRKCKRVPTFWAGKADDDDYIIADAIALVVAMVFGAVHCISWYSEFQSHLQQQLWRSSAIAIIAVPPALILGIFVGSLLDSAVVAYGVIGVLYTLLALVYITARLILITLSFTSLKGLHFAAYQTVQWTTFIPHI